MSYYDEYEPRPRRRKAVLSGMAIGSLIAGALGLLTCGIGGLVGLILGIQSASIIANSRGRVEGRPFAYTGIALSVLTMLAGFGVGTFWVIYPAVQQARYAPNRLRSEHKMKVMGLAAHNYHDGLTHLPRGTAQEGFEAGLPIERRLSFFASMLPQMEEGNLYRRLDFAQAWDSPANSVVTQARVEVYLSPTVPARSRDGNLTHYVGVAGYGPGCASLEVGDPRAGAFGYDRTTQFRDFKDGTANTMLIASLKGRFGPWAQGGPATVRGFTQRPYIGGDDGFGDPSGDILFVLLGDGSVRKLSGNVDPKIIEAMATVRGGEALTLDREER